jgi:hypothetical protein
LAVPSSKQGGTDFLVGDTSMATETLEEATRAQAQIEDFARQACAAWHTVDALISLEGLEDWPEGVDEAMDRLIDAVADVGGGALEWAQVGNANFDPFTPLSQQE